VAALPVICEALNLVEFDDAAAAVPKRQLPYMPLLGEHSAEQATGEQQEDVPVSGDSFVLVTPRPESACAAYMSNRRVHTPPQIARGASASSLSASYKSIPSPPPAHVLLPDDLW